MARSFDENPDKIARWYVQREPEFLTIDGYRTWLSGVSGQDPLTLKQIRNTYVSVMGRALGNHAANSLSLLVQALGVCATCPLRFLPPETNTLCRDECLLLGLVSAIQHGDHEALKLSASRLTCAARHHEILAPAGDFAISLKCSGRILLPIPVEVLGEISRQSVHFSSNVSSTLH